MSQPRIRSSAALDDQLCFALYSASRAITTAYRTVLAEHDLTYPQYLVLLALWEQDGQSVRELGQRLMLDSGTLSPLLRRLESSGRVDRRRASTDGRLLTVHLTAEGRALRPLVDHVQHHLGECLALDADEAAQLRTLARRIVTESTPPAPARGALDEGHTPTPKERS